MKLIVGLCNPGPAYANTRHNAGFMMLDRLAAYLEAGGERKQGQALVRPANDGSQRLLLAKPQTYMNLSGDSLLALLHFYKDGVDDFIIIHDDLDLPLGKLRFKAGGGSGGHKGLNSITTRLGGDRYDRLKVGVGRPPERMSAENYVLQDFSADEKEILERVLQQGLEELVYWTHEGAARAMNRFNAVDLRPASADGAQTENS